MEPMSPAPGPTPEKGGMPKSETSRPIERAPLSSPESRSTGEALASGPSDPAAPPAPIQPLQQLPAPQTAGGAVTKPVINDNPLVAADDEVIEKEWVQKAKKIVQDTKNDPHVQEKEVSKLQADYIKKRYGKEIKLNSNE